MKLSKDNSIPYYQRGLILGLSFGGAVAEATGIIRNDSLSPRFPVDQPVHPALWAKAANVYVTAQFHEQDAHFDVALLEKIAASPLAEPETRSLAAETLTRHLRREAAASLLQRDQVRSLIARLAGILQSIPA